MSDLVDRLVRFLALERIEHNLFRGQSKDLGWGTVFGGQVLGQALSAAVQTVPDDRLVHSMHAYFLRPGDVNLPIVYDVDRIRDGGSFTTRRVVAIQAGRPIFNMSASFHLHEPGFEHASPMPDVPAPDDLPSEFELMRRQADRLPPGMRGRAIAEGPFDLRAVEPLDDLLYPTPRPPVRQYWMRARGRLPDDLQVHRCLLAYISDYSFLTTALQPHGTNWLTPGMQVASLDHVMWFHRPFRVDEWLLYAIDSPAANDARGLVRGSIYTRDGVLVASTAQEGLMRQRETPGRGPGPR
jgi:acyl-CoA thioesterase-2